MHLIRFSPHGTNSDIKVQGLWRIQVFRVNICGIPNFHADRRVITAQEQEITPYFKAYESSSRLHIYFPSDAFQHHLPSYIFRLQYSTRL